MIQTFVLFTQKIVLMGFCITSWSARGYSYSNDFSKYFPPLSKEQIQEKVCAKWVPHDFGGERTIRDAIKTYKLASYVATLKREKHVLIAGLYIRTAWLYRMLGNDEQENRFLKLAIHEYYESFSTEDYKRTQVSEVRILYLLGELSRRVGYLDQTIKYFSMVIERQKTPLKRGLLKWPKNAGKKYATKKKKYHTMVNKNQFGRGSYHSLPNSLQINLIER